MEVNLHSSIRLFYLRRDNILYVHCTRQAFEGSAEVKNEWKLTSTPPYAIFIYVEIPKLYVHCTRQAFVGSSEVKNEWKLTSTPPYAFFICVEITYCMFTEQDKHSKVALRLGMSGS